MAYRFWTLATPTTACFSPSRSTVATISAVRTLGASRNSCETRDFLRKAYADIPAAVGAMRPILDANPQRTRSLITADVRTHNR